MVELMLYEQMLQEVARKVINPGRQWAAASYPSEV
jgi:hypothetical protein